MLRYSFYLLLLTIVFSSCEKVIDIDLNSSEKKLVIEGVLTTTIGSAKVLISETKDFKESNSFNGVSNAVVTITETGGSTTPLIETAKGIYEAPGLRGEVGKKYSLSVTLGTKIYTADCSMPTTVAFDSAFVTEENIFGNKQLLANVKYKDPLGKGNYYRFIQYLNGQKEKQLFTRDDEFSDGNQVIAKLWYSVEDDDSNKIESGKDLKIEMLCIAPAVFKYWDSLDRSATGENQSASPANPVTNMKGGALGYFSAHSVQEISFKVP